MKKILNLLICGILICGLTGCGKANDSLENKEKKCDQGYYLKDDNCIKIEDKKDLSVSYTCEDGYTLNETDKTCVKTDTQKAKIDNPCPSGYTFSNNSCTKVDKVAVTVKKSCLSGGQLIGDQCKYWNVTSSGVYEYYLNALQKKSCPSGYSNTEGDWCTKTLTSAITGTYYCDTGYQLNGTTCTKTSVNESKKDYYCEEGYEKIDNSCYKFESSNNDTDQNMSE